MLSLYRRRLSGFRPSRPPGVVWFGNLRGYPGNVRILLAIRNPRGRHRLMNMGPDIANSRYQRWLYLNSRTVAVSCHPYMPRFVSLFAVGLRTFGLVGVVACERQWRTAGSRRASSPRRWMFVVVLSTRSLLCEAVLLLLCRPSE